MLDVQGAAKNDPLYQKQQDQLALEYVQLVNALNFYQENLAKRANGGSRTEDIDREQDQEIQYANDDLLAQEQTLQRMEGKFSKIQTIVKEGRITINLRKEPIISQYPISPDVSQNLMIGTVSGVTIFPLLVFLLTAMYHRVFSQKRDEIQII